MDTLALLCNLHADGPETLQRLRSAGWDTLREIQAVDVLELERVLDADRGRAVRFQREAGILRDRLGGDHEPPVATNERESAVRQEASVSATESAPPARARALRSSADASPAPSPESGVRKPFAAARLSARESLPVNRFVTTTTVGELEDVNELALAHDRHAGADSELELPARDLLIPRPATASTPTLPVSPEPPSPEWQEAEEVRSSRAELTEIEPNEIEPNVIDGIDSEGSRLLAEAGVTSLAELAEAPALELASATGLEYTNLLRLQFLARRAQSSAPRETSPKVQRSEHKDASNASGDVAGPFA